MSNEEKFVNAILSPMEEDYGKCERCADGIIRLDGEYDGKEYYYCDVCDTEYTECDNCGELIPTDELEDTTEMINGGIGYCCEQCIEDCDMVEIGE